MEEECYCCVLVMLVCIFLDQAGEVIPQKVGLL